MSHRTTPGEMLFIFSVWIALGVWCAIDGHPSVLILLAGYILSMLAPFFIVWLWEKIKKFF